MQAHDLHQHLVGVGGAVEGAGAGAVIGLGLGLEQRVAADLALGVELADAAFSLLGRPEVIGPPGTKIAGRWPKLSAAITRPGTILSQTPSIERAVEHVVRQGDRRRHRDHVAREQRQLHAGLALGDAVAHRRHAARELGDAAGLAHRLLDQRRGRFRAAGAPTACRCRTRRWRCWPWRRRPVLLSSASQAAKPWARLLQDRRGRGVRPGCAAGADAVEIGCRVSRAALGDAIGDLADRWVQAHPIGVSFQAQPLAWRPRARCGRRARSGRSLGRVPRCRRI